MTRRATFICGSELVPASRFGVHPVQPGCGSSDWYRGKCSFKLIQYMAVGCPVVASDVGLNRDVVEDGEVGHLIREADWEHALAALLESIDLRARMGQAARQRVGERFDSSIAVATYRAILENLQ